MIAFSTGLRHVGGVHGLRAGGVLPMSFKMMPIRRTEGRLRGAALIEYALVVLLLALVVVLYIRLLSTGMTNTMNSVGTQMTRHDVPVTAPAAPEH